MIMTTPFSHACRELQAYMEAVYHRFEELTQYELDTVKDGLETRSVSRVCVEGMRPAIEYLAVIADRDEKRVALVTKDMFLLSNGLDREKVLVDGTLPVTEFTHVPEDGED
jgi:hypothetical protein